MINPSSDRVFAIWATAQCASSLVGDIINVSSMYATIVIPIDLRKRGGFSNFVNCRGPDVNPFGKGL